MPPRRGRHEQEDATHSGKALAARIERAIWIRVALANVGGALPLVVLGGEYVRRFTPRYNDLPLFWIGLAMTVVLFIPMWTTVVLGTRSALVRASAWIDEGRDPNPAELRLTATLARRVALLPAPWWLFACVLAVVIIHALGVAPTTSELVVGVVGILLGGLVSCVLSYLLAEDALRPLFRLVLAEQPPAQQQLGLRARLLAYWVAGSGAYLFGIALILENFPARIGRPIAIVCCALGAVVGFVMTNLSVGSITRPLDRLRRGMQQVESGDLNVSVDVDDPGDVGRLQAGFNRMVSGLRERDRLREVFGRHVGPEVAQRALQREGLEGSELNATVLFVDMIGSTTLAAERPPAAVVSMLNALFEAVVRIVANEGGFVNQFQGDGALCVFGAPEPKPDHATRALRAALSLRREIVRIGDTFPGFDAAIGVSTGRVVAGDVGTVDRHDYTVIGDPVNEASRLCDEAKQQPGRVLVSEESIRSARPENGWSPYGDIHLRGRPYPTTAYEPVG